MLAIIVSFLFFLVQFKNDEDFASNIQNNTPRYVRHFEDVVDDLLPPTTLDGAHGGDIFDFLQVFFFSTIPYNIIANRCLESF